MDPEYLGVGVFIVVSLKQTIYFGKFGPAAEKKIYSPQVSSPPVDIFISTHWCILKPLAGMGKRIGGADRMGINTTAVALSGQGDGWEIWVFGLRNIICFSCLQDDVSTHTFCECNILDYTYLNVFFGFIPTLRWCKEGGTFIECEVYHSRGVIAS